MDKKIDGNPQSNQSNHSLAEQSRKHRTNPISAQSDPAADPAADPFHKSHHFDSQIKVAVGACDSQRK